MYRNIWINLAVMMHERFPTFQIKTVVISKFSVPKTCKTVNNSMKIIKIECFWTVLICDST